MAQHGIAYQTACDWQKLLIAKAQAVETDSQSASVLAREWQNLERLKREMRGIPPLRAASVSEALALRKPKRIASTEPTEV